MVYINDFPNVSTVLNFRICAYDTNVFCNNDSLTDLGEIINGELSKLHVADWFKANRLSLAVKKSCFIAFSACNKRLPGRQAKLMIDGNPIEQVQSTKFWGVYIDECLTLNQNIKVISSKISKDLGILRRIARIIPSNVIITYYRAYTN